MLERGTLLMFPVKWETGRLDSILNDSYGNLIAYVVEKDDGTKVAIDMQVVELLDEY